MSGSPTIGAVIVAVPARDEAARIGRCLAAIDEAAATWGGPVVTLVGADACHDDTAQVVRELTATAMPLTLLEGVWRSAARVRRALVDVGRATLGDLAPDRVWVASTDADCIVPRHWIADQIAMADAGADIVLGEVALDPTDTSALLAGAFDLHYADLRTRRPHVHAANLGIRLSAYDRAGGWRSSAVVGEEHHLVRAAIGRGAQVQWAHAPTVVTSGRTAGRVRGGFASNLRRLDVGERTA